MVNTKKTLVILTPGFAKNEEDSTCLPLQQQLIRTIKDFRPQLNLIILSLQYPFSTNEYTWQGIRIIPFNGKKPLSRLFLRKNLKTTLKKIHATTPITCLLSFWYGECALAGKQFADEYDLKHFCWILGQDAKKENKYPQRYQPRPHELIALSDFLQNEFEKNHGIRPAHLVTAGINKKLFQTKKEKGIDIMGAGSLIPLKQYEIFIQIIAALKQKIPEIKAMLVGKGPEKDRLNALILQLGLQSNVVLTGELPHARVLDQMQRARLFLHTSSYEGFGVVAAEALYAGCHVISFTKPVKQEIEHWHIASSKEEMIEKAIVLLQDPLTDYKPVLFFTIEEAAQKMTTLLFESM